MRAFHSDNKIKTKYLTRVEGQKNLVHTVYPKCFCDRCKQKEALAKWNAEINGDILRKGKK